MPVLFALRHGPTGWNQEGRLQGRTDIPLSETGRAHVLSWRLPPEARSVPWFASPLARAAETTRLLGLDAACEPRLIEMNWGAWEGHITRDLRQSGILNAGHDAAGLDFRPPDGESYREVRERLRGWLAEVAATGRPAGMVAHKSILKALLSLATGWDMTGRKPARLHDGTLHRFILAPDGRPMVAGLNIPLNTPPSPDTSWP